MTLGFTLAQASIFGLVTSRIAGTVISSPLLWGEAPTRVRAALVVLLSIVAFPTQVVAPGFSMSDFVFSIPSEFIIGLAMGMVVRIVFSGVEVAGDAIGPAIGIQAGSYFDPTFQTNDNGIARLLRYGALLVALIGGTHRVIIGALIASFRVIPIATAVKPWQSAEAMVHVMTGAVASGVALALPLVAILFLTHIALAFVSRAAPSIQIFSVGFALTLAVGTLSLIIALPDFCSILSETYGHIGTSMETVLAPLVAR